MYGSTIRVGVSKDIGVTIEVGFVVENCKLFASIVPTHNLGRRSPRISAPCLLAVFGACEKSEL